MIEDAIEIVALTEASWADYRALRLRALQEEPQAFGQSYDGACAHPNELWQHRLRDARDGTSWLVFARQAGRLVGMVGAFRTDDDRRSGRATVVGTYVEATVRGRGVGRRLLEALLERLADDESVEVARLGVNQDQEAAVRLYAGAGFQVVAEGVVTLGDGVLHREFVMERPVR
jgi:ribosomal protein S18 acetylase RimI-like enzyme